MGATTLIANWQARLGHLELRSLAARGGYSRSSWNPEQTWQVLVAVERMAYMNGASSRKVEHLEAQIVIAADDLLHDQTEGQPRRQGKAVPRAPLRATIPALLPVLHASVIAYAMAAACPGALVVAYAVQMTGV